MHRAAIANPLLRYLMLFGVVLAAYAAGLSCLAASEESGPSLEVVLDRLDRVAALYRDNALHFTCEETVRHFTDRGNRTFRFHYIFVRDEDKKLMDYRLPRKRGKPKPGREPKSVPVSLERYRTRYGMPPPVKHAYTWINIFQKTRRDRYRYQLVGQDELLSRPALKLRFEPVPPYVSGINEWFGTAWVDRETHQLLRVEAMTPREYRKRQALERNLREFPGSKKKLRSTHVISEVLTDYGVERNGMRFPSEVVTRGVRYEVWGYDGNSGFREYPVFRLEQTYDDYRFYGVRTAGEIDRLVREGE